MIKFIFIFLFCLATPKNSFSQEKLSSREFKIIGMYIYQIAKTSKQPVITNKNQEYKMVFLGDDDRVINTYNQVKSTYQGKLIGNRTITVRQTKNISEFNNIDLLFVTNGFSQSGKEIKKAIKNYPTLYVGYERPYGEPIINLVTKNDKISMSINQKYVEKQRIKLDKRVIILASEVISNKEEWDLLLEKTAHQEEKIDEHISTISSQKGVIYFVLGFLFILTLSTVFIYSSYKSKNTALKEVERQKRIVDQKNIEILDSINYAKRIQSAILPQNKVVKSYLKKSFILYKPKDIVAGDFYWMEPKEEGVLIAAADCTGHGVPGAMVSVVCNNALNRSVREYGLINPGEILDKTREIVIQEFEKSEEEIKDGMDIALCLIQGGMLKYAGANNPLWIIRKGEKVIEEIKANKQPIGKFERPEAYTTHTLELADGDIVYIFTDGYVDQFGGDKGKKLKSKALKLLLLSMQNESMDKQKQLLEKAFDTWKGEVEQVDDVCIIGFQS